MSSQMSLRERVYLQLKDDILRCLLPPGLFLTEGDLAAKYEVSKTPIREALHRLAQEGFTESIPRRGTQIRTVDTNAVDETYLVRSLLEPPAAALAASRASEMQIEAIERHLKRMHTPVDSATTAYTQDQVRSHSEFHAAIGKASGVGLLFQIIRSIHEHMERYLNAHSGLAVVLPFAHMDQELCEAICDRDSQRAASVSFRSLYASRQELLDALLARHRSEQALLPFDNEYRGGLDGWDHTLLRNGASSFLGDVGRYVNLAEEKLD